ncbi:hypothetical protein AYI68_g2544 [Smittium mucronatum]|uniref:Uncharacterized protein n=1 Tax=Smittium mucronatum TaxID=133383 RepID=A0A1R0H2E7_9FUNG|nr:hypothetical protein AYI68_g2544 [Smittium mucronatum]
MSLADNLAEEAGVAPIARALGIGVLGGRPIRPDNLCMYRVILSTVSGLDLSFRYLSGPRYLVWVITGVMSIEGLTNEVNEAFSRAPKNSLNIRTFSYSSGFSTSINIDDFYAQTVPTFILQSL